LLHCFCTVCGACSLSNILGWNFQFQVLGSMLEPPSYSPLLHIAEVINFIATELSPIQMPVHIINLSEVSTVIQIAWILAIRSHIHTYMHSPVSQIDYHSWD